MKHNMKGTYCWEAKVVIGDKLYYKSDSFEKERRNLAICGSHFITKFSDLAGGTPFDGVSISESPGYIFVQFYSPRNKEFFVIEISEIEKDISAGSKYLDEEKSNKIAYLKGELK